MLVKLIEKYLALTTKHSILGCLGSILLLIVLLLIARITTEYLYSINKWIPISIGVSIFGYMLIFLFKERKRKKEGEIKCFEIGKILFKENNLEFENYYSLYLRNKVEFIKTHKKILKKVGYEEEEGPTYTEVLTAFAKSKKLITKITIKWESFDFEISGAIEKLIEENVSFTNLNKLYNETQEDKREKYQFVVQVLKEIDKDLKEVGKGLLFFTSDDYIVLCQKIEIIQKIKEYNVHEIHSIEQL